MNRREFLAATAGTALLGQRAWAQDTRAVHRVQPRFQVGTTAGDGSRISSGTGQLAPGTIVGLTRVL